MSLRTLLIAAGCIALLSLRAEGGLTAAQKKELAAIRAQLYRIKVPVKRDAIDEAESKTTDAEDRLKALAKEASLDDDSPVLAPVKKMIASRREAITKARDKELKDSRKKGKGAADHSMKRDSRAKKGGGSKPSFVADVAPILSRHCLGCHGADAKGGLRLDTFAGMTRGGKNPPLLVVGEPANSLLMARLTAPDARRMPKDAEPLSEKECLTIAEWIARGAKFDGDDEQKPLAKLVDKDAPTNKPQVSRLQKSPKLAVVRATGGEQVSFQRDIAPFIVERCLRCHSGNDPKGGLSLETFDNLLAGGKSGAVIEPGNLAKSRIWDLVGEQKPFKMPPGDARITRTHWNSLRTWILEGAKYDGPDPKQTLRSLVPTEEERRKAMIARTSPEEFRQRRRQRSDSLWQRALPRDPPRRIENQQVLVYGNAVPERLQDVAAWAAEAIRSAGTFFEDRSPQVFKGGLVVFVAKDRFSYEEFSQVVDKREPQATIHGHAVVTPDLSDAYVVIENLPDAAGQGKPGARANLVEQVGAAYLMRSAKKLPDWLVSGGGRVLANQPSAVSTAALWPQLYRLTGSLEKPEELFSDGTFSPAAARDVGAALLDFLIQSRGKSLLVRFVRSLQNGTSQAEAFRDVYGTDLRSAAVSFVGHARELAQRGSN